MEVILPDRDVCNVESIIFKETSNLDSNPEMFEFFVDFVILEWMFCQIKFPDK